MIAVPIRLSQANRCVSAWHRHHAEMPGGFDWFCIGAVKDGQVVGAAIAGRPTNRNSDDGQTVEVIRVATDGTRNASSSGTRLSAACLPPRMSRWPSGARMFRTR